MAENGKHRRILLNGGDDIPKEPQQADLPTDISQAGQQDSDADGAGKPAKAPKVKIDPSKPLCTGITRNIRTDTEYNKGLIKWFKTLFTGVPYPMDGDLTMFQVYPQSGTTSMGFACDQVVVYGRLKNGMIAANNDVDVYGFRDSNNNIIATRIYNKATGSSISPKRVLSVTTVWIISILLLLLAAAAYYTIGLPGIILALVIFFIITHMGAILKWMLVIGAISWLFGRKK